jgi:hypothetical protein
MINANTAALYVGVYSQIFNSSKNTSKKNTEKGMTSSLAPSYAAEPLFETCEFISKSNTPEKLSPKSDHSKP